MKYTLTTTFNGDYAVTTTGNNLAEVMLDHNADCREMAYRQYDPAKLDDVHGVTLVTYLNGYRTNVQRLRGAETWDMGTKYTYFIAKGETDKMWDVWG